MSESYFRIEQPSLRELLNDCKAGRIQLPDFQRSWVWREDRIVSLISSVSTSFPIGALMMLEAGGEVEFKPRQIQGIEKEFEKQKLEKLILDGQQRVTSLYQAILLNKAVKTKNSKGDEVKRWFYFKIMDVNDDSSDRDESILIVNESKIIKRYCEDGTDINLSSREAEYKHLLFPISEVFNWDKWREGFEDYWSGDDREEYRTIFRTFKDRVLENFSHYSVPLIILKRTITKEATCVVFEKVNTGGQPLDAFELVTAMFAGKGYDLRSDWGDGDKNTGRLGRLANWTKSVDPETSVLSGVQSTDFLQAISLMKTRDLRKKAESRKQPLPSVSGKRQALLNLQLEDYKKYEEKAEKGFVWAAEFLHMQCIFQRADIPYQSQLVPLAVILSDLGRVWKQEETRDKLIKWYWCGVFGELYSSASETRMAWDVVQVPDWTRKMSAKEPWTIRDATFEADRLESIRSRRSAAYKGVNALLMKQDAIDFIEGQKFSQSVFFDEDVDIHHIFPRAWCRKQKISDSECDSIINKTPLCRRTNKFLGGVAPSKYLKKLQDGNPSKNVNPVSSNSIGKYLRSHLIEPHFLWEDDFKAFMDARKKELYDHITAAMGKPG